MLDNIIKHSLKVEEVGCWILDKLNQNQYSFNKELMQAACLLHDITKTYHICWNKKNKGTCQILSPLKDFTEQEILNKFDKIGENIMFKGHTSHGLSAKLLLNHLGYPEVGKIVGAHTSPYVSDLSYEGILCYSDRHVLHEEIVSFNKRFKYVLKKYKHNYNKKSIKIIKDNTAELAKKIEDSGNFTFKQIEREFKK